MCSQQPTVRTRYCLYSIYCTVVVCTSRLRDGSLLNGHEAVAIPTTA